MALATQILHDSFDYDATGNPILGTGMGSWASFGNGVSEPRVTSGSLAFPGLPFSGNSVVLNNTAGGGTDASRVPVGTITTGTTYFSFITSLPSSSNAATGGAFFAGFDDHTTGATFTTAAGVFVRQDAGDTTKLDLGISTNGSANKVFSSAFSHDVPLFVVGSFTFGGNAKLDIYDGSSSVPLAEPAVHTVSSSGTDTTTAQLQSFYLRGNSGEPPSILIDELHVGTTWADVVPEPNLLGVVGVMAMASFARRARR
jgi:hypothetical protein